MVSSNNDTEESELYNAQLHLYKHISNIVSCMALKTAAELGIADAIHNHGKPMTLSELATAVKVHPSKHDFLHSSMRLLTHYGFFTKVSSQNGREETAYALTLPSKLLIRSKSPCLTPIIEGTFKPSMIDFWFSTKKWFNEDTKLTLFESATGQSFWSFLRNNNDPEELTHFQNGMTADSQMMKAGLKECKHVFEGLNSIVDVGGGTGCVARLISEIFPHLKCIVFDQPEVVANLNGTQNVSFVGGDMFKSIPSADAVFLKWILHDWNDECSLKILKNCKEAISGKGKGGRVLIIDVAIDEAADEHELTALKLKFDLQMMALFNGKEREKKEWEKLIYDAGFSSYKIMPVFGFKSLIELIP